MIKAHILNVFKFFIFFGSYKDLYCNQVVLFGAFGAKTDRHFNYFAFNLISGETYQKLVQYQYDLLKDIKDACEAVEKELELSHKSKRS